MVEKVPLHCLLCGQRTYLIPLTDTSTGERWRKRTHKELLERFQDLQGKNCIYAKMKDLCLKRDTMYQNSDGGFVYEKK